MDTLRELRRRVPLGVLVLAALALASIGLVALVQFGPTLPGPNVSEVLGLDIEPEECSPKDTEFRSPSEPSPAPGKWRREPSLPDSIDEIQAAAVAGRIFVGTGQVKGDSLDKVFAFDPREGRWQPLATTPEPLDHSRFVTYGGDLYVVGGFSEEETADGLWRFSPDDGRWTELEGMQHARGAHGAAVIGDRLYVVGGGLYRTRQGDVPEAALTTSMEVYDFRTGEWSEGPGIRTPRHHLAVAAVDGQLYTIGGRTPPDWSMDTAERFDPESDRWEDLPPLPQGSGGLTATAVNGEIYIVSGGDDNDGWVTPASWAFNPEKGRWRRLPDVGVPRHGSAAAAIHGRLYTFGGAPCAGPGRSDAVESLPAGSAPDESSSGDATH